VVCAFGLNVQTYWIRSFIRSRQVFRQHCQ